MLSSHKVDIERRVDRPLKPFRFGELEQRRVATAAANGEHDRVLGEPAPFGVGIEVKLLERFHLSFFFSTGAIDQSITNCDWFFFLRQSKEKKKRRRCLDEKISGCSLAAEAATPRATATAAAAKNWRRLLRLQCTDPQILSSSRGRGWALPWRRRLRRKRLLPTPTTRTSSRRLHHHRRRSRQPLPLPSAPCVASSPLSPRDAHRLLETLLFLKKIHKRSVIDSLGREKKK